MTDALDRLTAALSDRYMIERELGAGGMATVYLANDIKHERKVAIKVLKPELAAVLGADRFLSEIRTTASLQHPHILPLFDSGNVDGLLFYVMPFVAGVSLRDRLARETQLPLVDVLTITRELAGALDYAHQRGVIHRDIKPENILLDHGRPIIADFGIALSTGGVGPRLTETGMSLGTPEYMSPEQAMGERTLDGRSDIYSLGAVVYEMVAGEPPHTAATSQGVVAKLLTEQPVRLRIIRPSVSDAMDDAVARALAKAPADRFATAGEFAQALDSGITGGRIAKTHRHRWSKRNRVAVGLVTVAALALVARALTHFSAPPPAPSRFDLSAITTTGRAIAPALSPDGGTVAYIVDKCPGAATCDPTLVLQDVQHAATLSIAPGGSFYTDPVWSPDGKRIVFTAMMRGATPSPRSRAYLLNQPFGGIPQPLPFDLTIGFATSDTVIGITGRSDGKTQAVMFDLRGQKVVDSTLLPPTASARLSPDGRWIAAFAPGNSIATVPLLVIDRQGRVVDTVAMVTGWAQAEWGPGGAYLYYSNPGRTSTDLLRVAVDRATGRHRGKPSRVLPDVWHDWQGRGTRRFSVAVSTGALAYEMGATTYRIWAYVSGSAPRLLATPTAAGIVRLSPDGRTLARVLNGVGPDTSGNQLAVMPFGGGAERGIATLPPGSGLQWTADGHALTWYDWRRHSVVAVDAETGVLGWTIDLPPDSIWGSPIPLVPSGFAVLGRSRTDVRFLARNTAPRAIALPAGFHAFYLVAGPKPGDLIVVMQRQRNSSGYTVWRLGPPGSGWTQAMTVDTSRHASLVQWLAGDNLVFEVRTRDEDAYWLVSPSGEDWHRDPRWRGLLPSTMSADGRRGIHLEELNRSDIWLARPAR